MNTILAMSFFEFKSEWIINSLKDSIDTINTAIVEAIRILTMNPADNPALWGYVNTTKSVCVAFGMALIALFWFMNFLTSTIDLEMSRITPEFVMKHLLRLAFAKAVVQYAPDICVYIFNICADLIDSLGSVSVAFNDIDYTQLKNNLDEMGFTAKFIQFIQLWVPSIIVTCASAILKVIVYARTIEICLLTIISPLPLSTVSGDSHYHIAKGFLKEYTSCLLKGACIILSFGLFKACIGWFFNPTLTSTSGVWELATATLILIFLIIKSGNYVKAFFGGH